MASFTGDILLIGLLIYKELPQQIKQTYGQKFIEDDTFLSVVGSVAGAVHALSRVTVGLIQDKIFYKLFPNKKGFVTGIVASGLAVTPIFINSVQTFFVNPNNLQPASDGKTINNDKLSTSLKETPANANADDQQPYRNNEAELQVLPTEALKMKEFYLLSIVCMCSYYPYMFVNVFYKTYGQTFIEDDTFLSIVGSVAGAVHALSRVTVGLIQDQISYK
ncbi:uncharacterized protein LOC143243724, partial [Tachypleus tridentatus]|uniref:uncharacterized protein LOC143243724 n=1 Tax=Tachypleus tridentatus TaxID=6853 RepID=UPI003FD338D8